MYEEIQVIFVRTRASFQKKPQTLEARHNQAAFTDIRDDRYTAIAVSPTSSSAFYSSSKITVTAYYTFSGILAINKLTTFSVPLNTKE